MQIVLGYKTSAFGQPHWISHVCRNEITTAKHKGQNCERSHAHASSPLNRSECMSNLKKKYDKLPYEIFD